MRKAALAVCLLMVVVFSVDAAGRHRAVRKTPPADPYAQSDFYTVLRGGTLNVDAAHGVLVNDADPLGKPLTVTLLIAPEHGTLTLRPDGSFTYVHDGSAADGDSFVYRANNGKVNTNGAGVTISVTEAPQAIDDAYTTHQDTMLVAREPVVLANDILHHAFIVSYGVHGNEQRNLGSNTPTSAGGTVAIFGDGGFIYTPPQGFTGVDTFRYTIRHDAASDTAQVSITVTPPPPTATDDSHSATQATQLNVAAPGVLANDTLRGGTLTSYGASGNEQTTLDAPTPTSAGGTVRVNADGSFRYDPAGNFTGLDTFRYTLTNTVGSATATVTIAVQSSNTVEFTVTSPGFFFRFSGVSGDNPVLTLTRGRTYRFRVQTDSIHPFAILDAPPGTVTNNDISNGILTFAVPPGPGAYRYHCPLHAFGNSIETTP